MMDADVCCEISAWYNERDAAALVLPPPSDSGLIASVTKRYPRNVVGPQTDAVIGRLGLSGSWVPDFASMGWMANEEGDIDA